MVRKELRMPISLFLCVETPACTDTLKPSNEAFMISLYTHCYPSYIVRKIYLTFQPHFLWLKSIQLTFSAPSGTETPSIKWLCITFFSAGLQSHINFWFLCHLSGYSPFPGCIILSS